MSTEGRRRSITRPSANHPPLPYAKDEYGKANPWTTTEEEWQHELRESRTKAEKAIDSTRDDASGTWQHAKSFGNTEQTRAISILYAQWSMAVEATVIAKGNDGRKSNKQRGRGLQPTYRWETLANRSSSLPIEHVIWSLPKPIARAGSDLFSTLWTAIAGALRAIASAKRLDDNQGGGAHIARAQRLYGDFFQLLGGIGRNHYRGVVLLLCVLHPLGCHRVVWHLQSPSVPPLSRSIVSRRGRSLLSLMAWTSSK